MDETEFEVGCGRLREANASVVADAALWHRAHPDAGLSSRVEWRRLVDQGVDMDRVYFEIYGEYPL